MVDALKDLSCDLLNLSVGHVRSVHGGARDWNRRFTGLVFLIFLLWISESVVNFLRFQINLKVRFLRNHFLLNLNWSQFHESFIVGLVMPEHVLFKEQIVSGRQMVVLIVFNWLQKTFPIEFLLGFKVLNNLLVQQVWPLNKLILLTILLNDVGAFCLDCRRAYVETLSFRLVHLIPRMLSDLLDIDSVSWFSDENLAYHRPGFFREEIREIIVCIKNFLIKVWSFLIFIW